MSFFEEKERFWIFGLESERFYGLFSRQGLEMDIDDNFDMIRKTNLVLNLKRLSRNIENLLVCLKQGLGTGTVGTGTGTGLFCPEPEPDPEP